MNNTFHVYIRWYQYLFMILLGGLSFYLLWYKHAPPAVLFMTLLVIVIERFIHTTYLVTVDGKLIINCGRFGGSKTVWLKDIVSVEQRRSVKIFGFSLLRYVIIQLNTGRYLSLVPVKEEEFVQLLLERIETLHNNINE